MRGLTRRQRPFDYAFLAIALLLLHFGCVMLYSASAILADRDHSDPLFFLKRQLVWAVFGLLLMTAASRFNYNRLREWVWPIVLLTVTMLAAVLFSDPIAGAKRWIRLGSFGLQPAEFAKLTVVLFLADYLDRKRSKMSSILSGIFIPGLIIGLILVLIALEPDIGTPVLIFAVGSMVLFIGGTRLKHLAGTLCCAVPVLLFELLRLPYRRDRLLNFLHPFSDAQGTGYQLVQSLLAVGSGGWFGKGLGASKLKLMYLPKPHTDFIFPVVCEELGLLGATMVVGLFALLLIRGIRIAKYAPNLFGTILAAGLTFMICLQALFNISMSIGLLPTKGVPLPFFSYGGSSLLTTLIAIGILLNISRYSTEKGRSPQRSG